MDLELLDRALESLGQPAFRSRQVWEWAARGAGGYEAMTNVPRALRDTLAESMPFSTLDVVSEARSRDGTVKTLFHTADGHPVEAVLMRFRDGRRSVCVSSQSGCPLTCTFCATGSMRFGRNLTASEILDQVLHFVRGERSSRSRGGARGAGPKGTVLGHGPGRHGAASGVRGGGAGLRPAGAGPAGGVTHLVFMGMGEPMMNLDGVIGAARRLPDIGITHRRTTVSTVGWLPGLERFVTEVSEPIRLALSLHAADPGLRSHLMPVNDRYPVDAVLEECRRYVTTRRRRVFVEYVMLAGVNDSVAQARALARLLGTDAFKVNLIPYNPTGSYDGSSRDAIERFRAELERARVPVTVRLTRGRDIAAACGQLAAAPRPRRAAVLPG